MRIDFIGHATLLVRSGGLSLLTDPWWASPAYAEQWFPYPFPVPERYDLGALDALYLSHGHEDHVHEDTLRALPSRPTVIVPRSFEAGGREHLASLGFRSVCELPGGSSTTLRRGRDHMRITVFTHLGDSILAVEADRQVMLNLNDALHGARPDTIDAYCRDLRRRFPRIDYLFCGFGGASYFPNCFRVPGKDDLAVARRREQLFLDNFARIARLLEPRAAFPFAAHFVLPAKRNWWISELRLSLKPAEVIHRLVPSVPCHDLSPGDHVEDGRVHASTPPACDDVRAAVLGRYPMSAPAGAAFEPLVEQIRANATRFAGRLRGARLSGLLKLTDVPGRAIRVEAGDRPRCGVVDEDTPAGVVLETESRILSGAVSSRYGRDLIVIGYGAIVRIGSASMLSAQPHERLLDLITPYPTWPERLRSEPLRLASYLLRDPGARLAIKRKLQWRRADPGLYALERWT